MTLGVPTARELSARPEARPTHNELVFRGVLYLAVMLTAIGVLCGQFAGVFTDKFVVRASLTDPGDALVSGSDVKLRGVVVGRVGSIKRSLDTPGAIVELLLAPAQIRAIPAAVTARSLPANFFGQSFIDLVPPAPGVESPGLLASGQLIPEDRSKESVELQDVFNRLYRVLSAVQPAKLQAALGALAEALDGRGTKLNSLIARTDSYLRELGPELPTLRADLTALARTAESFSRQSPRLLDSFDDLLVTTRTLVARQEQFVALLGSGLGLAKNADTFLSRSERRSVTVLRQARPIVGALADNPTGFSDGFVNLGRFLGGLTAHEGGKIGLDTLLDPADLPGYGPADCPRYPGLDGPNCRTPAPRTVGRAVAAAAAAPVYGGTTGPIGSLTEKLALAEVLSALGGEARRGQSFGDVGVLLVGSLLRGTTVLLP
jgi:phospholipid/cholesterol/gamma-HCH transport system substrate-binding protein